MSEEYFEHARREMFPMLKASAMVLTICGEPDPQLCLELGAAILFNKPLLVVVPRGRECPLALRTIATKIVDEFDENDRTAELRLNTAIREIFDLLKFR